MHRYECFYLQVLKIPTSITVFVRFCRLMLHTNIDNFDFLKSIAWTDESKCTKKGILTQHKFHHWTPKETTPRVKRQISFQKRFSINVWVIESQVMGPHFLPKNINEDKYLEFFQSDLVFLFHVQVTL